MHLIPFGLDELDEEQLDNHNQVVLKEEFKEYE